jgi:predicted nucleic acid-binding protein
MNRVLLDTSAYSAFMRGHPGVKATLQRADAILIDPVVLGELIAGFLRGKHTGRNREELSAFLSSPRVATLSVNDETAERYAIILHSLWGAGTPVPTNDIWIAASAMQHGLRVVTTDTHYRAIPQVLVDFHEP